MLKIKKLIAWMMLLGIPLIGIGDENDQRDSIIQSALASLPENRTKVDSLAEWAWELKQTDSVRAFGYATEGLSLAIKLDYPNGEIDCRNRKAIILELQGRHEEAIESYQKALDLAITKNDSFAIGRGYHQIAVNHRLMGNYTSAIELESKAIATFQSIPNMGKFLSMIYGNMGTMSQQLDNYEQARTYFYAGLKEIEELKAPYEEATLYYGLGSLYENIGMYQSAVEEYFKSLRIHQSIKNLQDVASTHIGLGNSFLQLNQVDSALSHYQTSLSLGQSLTKNELVSGMYHNMGFIYQRKKKWNQALNYFNQALDQRKKLGYQRQIAQSFKAIGMVKYQQKNYKEASVFFENCLNIADSLNDLDLQAEVSRNLIYTYKERGFTEKALSLVNKSFTLRDSISRSQTQTRDLEVKYQKKQIALQDEVNSLKLEALEKENKTIMVYATAIFLFLIIVVAILLIISKQRSIIAKKDKEITRAKARIKGQDDERERISDILHDEVGGILSMVQASFSEFEDDIRILEEKKKSKYSKSKELLGQAINSVRHLSHELGNSILKNFGLVAAFEDLTSTIEEINHLDTDFSPIGINDGDRFDLELEDRIFKIARELALNTVKHASANILSISLIKEENLLEIVVQDDGIGFDPNQNPDGGIGLINLKAKIKEIDGTYEVDTNKGAGTTFTIKIPISQLNNPSFL